jgi:hypothetical protein
MLEFTLFWMPNYNEVRAEIVIFGNQREALLPAV